MQSLVAPPLLTDRGLPSTVLGTLLGCLLFAVGDAVGVGATACSNKDVRSS
jgi:hypothetical protein